MGLLDKFIKPSIVEGVPSSMARIRVDDGSYRQSVEQIIRFIGANQWKSQLTGFQIGFVSKNKKFMELVAKNGNQLDIMHQATQVSDRTRVMAAYYSMLLPRDRKLFRIQIAMRVKVTSKSSPVTAIYDSHLEDICNLVTLAYLKKEYPDIHTLFSREINIPSFKMLESSLKDQLKFDLEIPAKYKIKGLELIREEVREWDCEIQDEHRMLGDVLGFPKYVMTA